MNIWTNHLTRRFSIRATLRRSALTILIASSLAATGCDRLDGWTPRETEPYDPDRVGSIASPANDDFRLA